jgi:hypothetical protein
MEENQCMKYTIRDIIKYLIEGIFLCEGARYEVVQSAHVLDVHRREQLPCTQY